MIDTFTKCGLDVERYDNYFMFDAMGSKFGLPKSFAEDLAHWILANGPEEPPRDREADMKKLAEYVRNKSIGNPSASIASALANLTNDLDIAAAMVLGIFKDFHQSESLKKYVNDLIENYPEWLYDRALGTGGD